MLLASGGFPLPDVAELPASEWIGKSELNRMCPKDFVSNRNINTIQEESPRIPINWNL